eukprot:NODE_37_length_35953_cov_1.028037.p2 type:complete len:841 gc:universal NODE_37_length_35953_cov_1.028037:9620-12142(+)
MIGHFIKSTVFEVFFLLAKDNEIIDKLVAIGHLTDVVQNLAYIFYYTIPWGNPVFQNICMYLNLNFKNNVVFAISLLFILLFIFNFSYLCWQVQSNGSIHTTKILAVTRYQYGLLSTLLFFPTLEQLLNNIEFDTGLALFIALVCIMVLIVYCIIVCLGAFLLFSPTPNVRSHTGRNSQRIDLFEILFKVFTAIGFGFFDPKIGCFVLLLGWTILYTSSFIAPAFYNFSSNIIRSGFFLGLLISSLSSVAVTFNPSRRYYSCYLMIVGFILSSLVGMIIYYFYIKSRKLPPGIFFYALKCIESRGSSSSIKYRSMLRNITDEWISTMWSPLEVVNVIQILCNIVYSKNKESFIHSLVMNQEEDENEKENEVLEADVVEKREGRKDEKLLYKISINFNEIARLVCLQVYESGKNRFETSTWISAQYLMFLEFSNDIFPNLKNLRSLKFHAEELLNRTFLEEKSIDVHYVLFSFYKMKVFEKARTKKGYLKKVVDIVAFQHDKDKFIENLHLVINSGKQLVSLLEKNLLTFDLFVSISSDFQMHWNLAKEYLKKGLNREPMSGELLLLFKESTFIFDKNKDLGFYLNSVMNANARASEEKLLGSLEDNEIMIEKHKKSLFQTRNHLPMHLARVYKFSEVFFRTQFILALLLYVSFFCLVLFYLKDQDLFLIKENYKVLTYGISCQSFFYNKFSFQYLQNSSFFQACGDDVMYMKAEWKEILTSDYLKQLKPSPFELNVTNFDNDLEYTSFGIQNGDFQWNANNFLKDTSQDININQNMAFINQNYLEFFKSIHETSESKFDALLAKFLVYFGAFYFLLIVSLFPMSYYLYNSIKLDMYLRFM